jgi:5-methylcytosine-specific restriction endonuclease McrA
MGRRPGVQQLSRRGRCGPEPYRRFWGSLRRACELLAAHHRGEMSREELLRAGPGPRPASRRPIPLDLRWRILRRDHFRCAACGKSPATQPGLDLEIDHIVPVSRGGKNGEDNLRALCGECNRGKNDGE